MRLKEWRESNGFSQQDMANLISAASGSPVSQQNVYNWEHGTMPNAVIGEAIRKITDGQVTGDSFRRAEP